nr:hypothetical protein Iba_chr07cCG7700 [Ipomoea batatas]
MVRARCSPGSKVPGYRSSDLNGESKVLTPGVRCPVTGLRTLMQGAHPGSKVPGYRSSDLNGESKVPGYRSSDLNGRSADGSTPGPVAPSAVCPALGAAASSAVGPAEASERGTGNTCSSGAVEKGVGPGSGTSSGSTTKTLWRSPSSIETSKAARMSFCMARRPLLNAQVPKSYIKSSPIGVHEIAARTASQSPALGRYA